MDSLRLARPPVSETLMVDLLTIWAESMLAPENPATPLVQRLAAENLRLRVELEGLRAELARPRPVPSPLDEGGPDAPD